MGTRSILIGLVALGMTTAAACSEDNTGAGGFGNQGGGGESASGGLEIQNLNVTIDQANQKVKLTFVVDNNSHKTVADCASASITTSTGDEAVVDTDYNGDCSGFGLTDDMDPAADFCGLQSLCDFGLGPDTTTGVITLQGDANPGVPQPWAESGTEYTLKIQLIMDDASILNVSGKATVL